MTIGEGTPAGAVSARDFHTERDALDRARAALAIGASCIGVTDLARLVAELEAYRLAAADKFTEAKIVGVYLLNGLPRVMEMVYSTEDFDDPITEAMHRIEQVTGPRWEWAEPPILYTRERVVSEWVEWNYE